MADINILSIWRWWRSELGGLLPPGDARKHASRRADVEIYVREADAAVSLRPRLAQPFKPRNSAKDLPALLAKLKRGRRAIVTLDAAHCLIRTHALPSGAMAEAQNMLDLELGRSTPFRKEDVVSGWYVAGRAAHGGQTEVVHAVLRKSLLANVLDTLAEKKLRPAAIAIRQANGAALPLVLDPKGKPFGAAERAAWGKAAIAAVAIALAMGAAASGLLLMKQSDELAALDIELERLEREARKTRAAIDVRSAALRKAESLAALRKGRVRPLGDWEEISRLLPDGVWLQQAAIDAKAVTLDGFATNPEALVSALEASPRFKNAGFAAPLFKNPSEPQVRFSIRFEPERLAP